MAGVKGLNIGALIEMHGLASAEEGAGEGCRGGTLLDIALRGGFKYYSKSMSHFGVTQITTRLAAFYV